MGTHQVIDSNTIISQTLNVLILKIYWGFERSFPIRDLQKVLMSEYLAELIVGPFCQGGLLSIIVKPSSWHGTWAQLIKDSL